MQSNFLNKIIAIVLLVLLPSVISAATITWDVLRRMTQDTDNNSNLQLITMGYEFDKLSRITKQTQKIGSGTTQNVIRYFDTFGHRTRITYPHSRNVDTTFTALHQVDEIKTDVGAGIVTVANYDYLYDSGVDKRPLVAKNTLHSGTDTRSNFGYDSMGRVTKKNWVDISAATTLSGFEYTYDLYGNRLTDNQLDRSQDSHTYLYDTAQRFTKMERGTIGGTPSFYQGYTLDALANWSSFNNNGTTESRSHDVMNAITARGATSLSHDLNGKLTNDGNQKYIWDELNRLVEVRDSGNNIICDYYYNADNLRVEKHHAGGAKEQFYYDGARVLVETDGSQTKVREYVNGGQYIDEVILVVNGSTYNYYMSDLRYCVTGFVDSTGAVVERARYDGYGMRTLLDSSYATITTANVDQSYGYTGIRHDNESDLQYYRARYFDNTLGRFINHDPLGYVDGMNLYRGYFVPNDLDPSGKETCTGTWVHGVKFDKLLSPIIPYGNYSLSPSFTLGGFSLFKFELLFDVKVCIKVSCVCIKSTTKILPCGKNAIETTTRRFNQRFCVGIYNLGVPVTIRTWGNVPYQILLKSFNLGAMAGYAENQINNLESMSRSFFNVNKLCSPDRQSYFNSRVNYAVAVIRAVFSGMTALGI